MAWHHHHVSVESCPPKKAVSDPWTVHSASQKACAQRGVGLVTNVACLVVVSNQQLLVSNYTIHRSSLSLFVQVFDLLWSIPLGFYARYRGLAIAELRHIGHICPPEVNHCRLLSLSVSSCLSMDLSLLVEINTAQESDVFVEPIGEGSRAQKYSLTREKLIV